MLHAWPSRGLLPWPGPDNITRLNHAAVNFFHVISITLPKRLASGRSVSLTNARASTILCVSGASERTMHFREVQKHRRYHLEPYPPQQEWRILFGWVAAKINISTRAN